MQNDLAMKDALLGRGVYAWPIGDKGVSMVDTRDIAEVAALCLLQRENAPEPLSRETIEIAGPRRADRPRDRRSLVEGARSRNPVRRR